MIEFDNYVNKFNLNDKLTILKYNHSYRVSSLCKILATRLKFSDSDIKLAEFIGLIHDIGRFDQIDKYNTLSDINTMDHGDFGAYLLFEEGLIKKFNINKSNYDLINICVKNHNKYSITFDYEERILKFLKLIRDADKIDIFNIFANLDEIDFSCKENISKEVLDDFDNRVLIHNYNKKTDSDSIVGTLSYIFDIYYKESYEYILENDLINKFYNRLEYKNKFKELIDKIDSYIKEKLC